MKACPLKTLMAHHSNMEGFRHDWNININQGVKIRALVGFFKITFDIIRENPTIARMYFLLTSTFTNCNYRYSTPLIKNKISI